MTEKLRKMPIGYGMVQTAVMRLEGLSIQAKSVYALLASYTGSSEFCFPTMETIARDLGFKSRKSPQKYLAELEKFGLIKRGKLYPDNPLKTHNTYRVMYIEASDKPRRAPQYPSTGITVPTGRAPQYPHNNNIYNNNSELTPPEGELTPPTEEKTPRKQDTNIQSANLPEKTRKNEWVMVPEKMAYDFRDSDNIALLNLTDEKIITSLPKYLENNEKR